MKILKTTIAILVLLSTSFFSNAQEGNLKFGVKGGVNFSNLSKDNAEDNKMLIGVNLGLFAKLPITKSIAIQPEIYFTTKGSKLTYNNVS